MEKLFETQYSGKKKNVITGKKTKKKNYGKKKKKKKKAKFIFDGSEFQVKNCVEQRISRRRNIFLGCHIIDK